MRQASLRTAPQIARLLGRGGAAQAGAPCLQNVGGPGGAAGAGTAEAIGLVVTPRSSMNCPTPPNCCLAPTDLRARVYAAFDVHALYRAEMNQATITAKVTDATPQLTQALLDDLRTDHDTHGPARTNPAISAVAVVFTLQDSVPLLA